MKFRSKFNNSFTKRGCFHYAILKAYNTRDLQSFVQNLKYKFFKIFKILYKTPYFATMFGHYGVIIEDL